MPSILSLIFLALVGLQGAFSASELEEVLQKVNVALAKFQEEAVEAIKQGDNMIQVTLNANLQAVMKTIDDGAKVIQENVGHGLGEIGELEDEAKESGQDLSECSATAKSDLREVMQKLTDALKECSNKVGEDSKGKSSEFHASKVEELSLTYSTFVRSKNECLEDENVECLKGQLELITNRIYTFNVILLIDMQQTIIKINAFAKALGPCSSQAEADSSDLAAAKVNVVQECFDSISK